MAGRSPTRRSGCRSLHTSVRRRRPPVIGLGSTASRSLMGRVPEMAVSPGGRPMDTSPFSASTTDNWVARTGGLNSYIRGVAHAVLRTGRAKDEATAISLAVAAIKRWAAGGDHVHPQVQAAAAAALPDWNPKPAKSHSHANDGDAVTDTVDLSWNAALHPRGAAGT